MSWVGTLIVPLSIAGLLIASAPRSLGEITWTAMADLARPRAYASATLLPTGEVFIFGGLDDKDPDVVSGVTELVDPVSNKVRQIAQPLPGRLHHTLTLASDDRLVVAGGVEWYDGKFHSSDRVDIYESFKHQWVRASALIHARSDHGAAPLPGGRVLVTGGNFGTIPLSTTEIYDPGTNTWHEAAPIPEPRVRFSIAPLHDGRVLVAGGLSRIGQPMASSAIYDPAKDTWAAGPNMSVARVQQAMVALSSGDVLLIGGQLAAANTAERYDARHGVFVSAGTLAEPRLIVQAAQLADGRVLITGGSVQKPENLDWVPVAGAEIWDPRTDQWTAFKSPVTNRALGDLVVVGADAYLIGGIGDGLAALSSIERLSLR